MATLLASARRPAAPKRRRRDRTAPKPGRAQAPPRGRQPAPSVRSMRRRRQTSVSNAPGPPHRSGPLLPGAAPPPASKAPPRRPTPLTPPTSPRRPTPLEPPAPYPAPPHPLLQRLRPPPRGAKAPPQRPYRPKAAPKPGRAQDRLCGAPRGRHPAPKPPPRASARAVSTVYAQTSSDVGLQCPWATPPERPLTAPPHPLLQRLHPAGPLPSNRRPFAGRADGRGEGACGGRVCGSRRSA